MIELDNTTAGKTIDVRQSIYDICKTYPEVVAIMKSLGFESITSPGMLNTAGRIMTLPKGALMKHISMDRIKAVFASEGFEILDEQQVF